MLSRDADSARQKLGEGVRALEWADPKTQAPPAEAFAGQDAVVHLLGEPIAQRWSDDVKREIRDSRVLSTRNLVAVLRDLDPAERPSVLVSQSASGWYGARGDERVDESGPGRRRLPGPGVRGLGGRGPRRRRAGRARGVHAHRRGAVRGRRRAGEDAAPVQARRGRPRRRRQAVRALGPLRRRGRRAAALPRPGLGRRAGERERPRAGDQRRAVQGARAGAGPARRSHPCPASR